MLPEALHQVTITMSDRGIPYSYRHMHCYGEHTYSMINAENRRFWVKYHFRTQQGIKNLTDAEAEVLIGKDRESHQRDLFEAIERGDFPRWTLSIQIMTEDEAKSYKENPFDVTKVWSQKTFPLHEVGVLELNRNPENYFADVEQAAFTPANIVPGLGLSPDKLLQARMFVYGDAHRYRLGVNHHSIPVNKPQAPVHSYHRDGQMRVDGNEGATIGYQPNSIGEWTDQPNLAEPPLEVMGMMAAHEPKDDRTDDCFYQAGALYRLMSAAQQQVLIENTVRNIESVTQNIQLRHSAHCYLADKDYGTNLAKALQLDLTEVVRLSELTHDERMKATAGK
jgi:catalase